jgi:hypothetical protein
LEFYWLYPYLFQYFSNLNRKFIKFFTSKIHQEMNEWMNEWMNWFG